jgi:hypothetical protein
MAKCPKACSGACTCGVKKKRKTTVRRAAPARVFRGQTVNVLGGSEQQYVNNLMANLQAMPFRNVAQQAYPNFPPMTGTAATLPQGAVPLAPVMPRATATTLAGTTPPETRTGVTQTVTPRVGNYQAGFMNILPRVVPPMALAAQARDIGVAEGYRQGRVRGEAIGAQAAVEGLRFRQTAGTAATYTVPELQQRFAEGQIIRATGGRPRAAEAVQAVAEEAAPK